MQLRQNYSIMKQLKKIILTFFILLFATSITTAQIPDTAKIKRSKIIKANNKIAIPNQPIIQKKDTALFERVEPGIRNRVPAENIERIPPLQIQKAYPDYLSIGNYTIVVEAYDKGGTWNSRLKTYKKLNGTGWIKLNCSGGMFDFSILNIWKDATIKPVKYIVVEGSSTNEKEISIRDAKALGIEARTGSEVEVMMPHVEEKTVPLADYIREVEIRKKESGIPVRFTNLSVKVTNAGAKEGTVISGIANFPRDQLESGTGTIISDVTESPVDELELRRRRVAISDRDKLQAGILRLKDSYSLNIYPGFQLEIYSMIFSPKEDPLVNARLILPPTLIRSRSCARGSLSLGNFRLLPNCEFYKEFPGNNYGTFAVGNSTLAIEGKGFVVDFSSSQSYSPVGKPTSWKGVVFLEGESTGTPSGTVVSNTGYLQAHYKFANGIVESSGMSATFNLMNPYSYTTTQPYDYKINFNKAHLDVASSAITGGSITGGTASLPYAAVRDALDNPIEIGDLRLTVKPSLDVVGMAIVKHDVCMYWGDLIKASGGDRKSFGASRFTRQVRLFFAATPRLPFMPTTPNGKNFSFPSGAITSTLIDNLNMQGATFEGIEMLVINTPDIPNGSSWDPNKPKLNPMDNEIYYMPRGKNNWINVASEGVNCRISGILDESPNHKLGDYKNPQYVGNSPFDVKNRLKSNIGSILLECVESAVLECDYRAFVDLPDPTSNTLSFKDMVFTSTANNAGGKLQLQSNDSLGYWGLGLVPKPGFSSAGLISVKTGQIILTAAGLSEKRHFAQPFWITWGEILADGSLGRLFFDFNSAGQQFDHFNYIHDAVALSEYIPGEKGFLRVGGTAFFPFFGGNYLHIKDIYNPSLSVHPYFKRVIELSDETLTGFMPSDLNVHGNWRDGTAIFDFDLKYADMTQDGFLGEGTSLLSKHLSGGELGSSLDMNSRGTCIRIGSNMMDQRSISLGPVANVSNITRIWGCACINGDGIENMVLGGEVTNAANVSIAARTGASLIAMMQITPSMTRLTLDGQAYMSIMASLDAKINGHMQLTLNHGDNFVEGEVAGNIRVAEGAILVGASLEAEGQLNWHLGTDFNELQGMVNLDIMGVGGSDGIGAGFYVGQNAPKSRAWILTGADPRYNLNMTPMPDHLTGVYGFVSVEHGINLYVVSGGYNLYAALGAFLNTDMAVPVPYVVGNLGGRIHGDILGGLVSAAAYFNCQLLVGIPIGFEGTVGLEACVLWVACGSVDLTIGLNSAEGFYIE